MLEVHNIVPVELAWGSSPSRDLGSDYSVVNRPQGEAQGFSRTQNLSGVSVLTQKYCSGFHVLLNNPGKDIECILCEEGGLPPDQPGDTWRKCVCVCGGGLAV